jgi:hypothetical protein
VIQKRSMFVIVGSTNNQAIEVGGGLVDTRIVAIYYEREPAEQHVKLANDEAFRIHRSDDRYKEFTHNPYDIDLDDLRYLYNYVVQEVPFVVHVDEYLEAYTKE